MNDETTPVVKVGDKLAFREGFAGMVRLYKVTKITPSGRIVCGRYTLNPNLTIRGIQSRHTYTWKGEIVTDKILAEVRRQDNLRYLEDVKWKALTDEQLEKVVAVLPEVTE